MSTRARVRHFAAVVALAVTFTVGCERESAPSGTSNELQNLPATKAGVADDGVRTLPPKGTVVPKGGLRDPSVLPVNPKGGLRDPSVKPVSPKAGTTVESIGAVDPTGPQPSP